MAWGSPIRPVALRQPAGRHAHTAGPPRGARQAGATARIDAAPAPPVAGALARRVLALCSGFVLWLAAALPAAAQVNVGPLGWVDPNSTKFELSEAIRVDQIDTGVRTLLDQAGQYVADGHWTEAIDTLQRVAEQAGERLIAIDKWRYIAVRDYCRLQLGRLPPEGLAEYRRRVDPAAERWYREGLAERSAEKLYQVLQRGWGSSWTDETLVALGEMALEQGDYSAARHWWEQAIPASALGQHAATWLCVPDSDVDLAAVRARLVLVSILEGSAARAREELQQFRQLHPVDSGSIGGRTGNYAEMLEQLLEESVAWPGPAPDHRWLTLAGNSRRNKTLADPLPQIGTASWRVPLPPAIAGDSLLAAFRVIRPHVAEDVHAPLSYHPVSSGGLLFVNTATEVFGFDLRTGQPAWSAPSFAIFRDALAQQLLAAENLEGSLGTVRHTMTIHGGRLYARMGAAVTCRPRPSISPEPSAGYLIALDLHAQGRLLWRIAAPEPSLAFEGAPVADGRRVYAALRRSDIQPQLLVAAFDADSGHVLWQRPICAAETPGHGTFSEVTHLLLTLDRNRLYLNTHAGAVASLDAGDGSIRWLSLYPRVTKGDLLNLPPHFCRDLTPCLLDRGIVYAAPSDSPRIFAFDAASGQVLWYTGTEVADVVHLLGVAGDRLIASGDRIYWIAVRGPQAGRVVALWPESYERLGFGRGLVAGGRVYWPTREAIFVFDAESGTLRQQIDLVSRGVTGGNLLVSDGHLLIAGSDRLVAFALGSPATAKQEPQLARVPQQPHSPAE